MSHVKKSPIYMASSVHSDASTMLEMQEGNNPTF